MTQPYYQRVECSLMELDDYPTVLLSVATSLR